MQVSSHHAQPTTTVCDLLTIAVFKGALARTEAFKAADSAMGGALKSAAKDYDFTGKADQVAILDTLGKIRSTRIALVGMGDADGCDAARLVVLGGIATRTANRIGAKTAVLALPKELAGAAQAEKLGLIARGAALGSYRYTEYKEGGRKPSLNKLMLNTGDAKASAGVSTALKKAVAVAQGVALARDLVNESPLQLYPESFAARATTMAKKVGLKCKVLKPDQLKRMGMNLLLGVGAGSSRGPRLVHLSYEPGSGKSAAKAKGGATVFVGKGITFDSGGLSLKPPAGMMDMKIDMAGAAAVIGAMSAVAQLKPKTAVHGLLVLAENMPSGTAIRPGDVIRSAAGKTVEINNTDAEGRLVLADALNYAVGLKPKRIVDLATLTGACMVALGPNTTGVFSNDEALADSILESAKDAGEDFWRMPLTMSLKEQLKSDVADMKNTGERWGGAITAALFLKEFVGKNAWAHLDIAGPASSSREHGPLQKGGTGVGVATLVDLVS